MKDELPMGASPIQAAIAAELHYSWDESGNDQFPHRLSIASDHLATLWVHTNRKDPGAGSVGIYRDQLKPAQTARLTEKLRTSEFARIENPDLMSGAPAEQLTVKESDGRVVSRYLPLNSGASPTFREACDEARSLASQVRQHPLCVVQLAATIAAPRLVQGNPLPLRLTIANPGPQPFVLPPANQWSDKDWTLSLIGARSDLSDAERVLLDATGEELTFELLETDKSSPLAVQGGGLQHGQRADFAFAVPLDWPPGQYDLTLDLLFPPQDDMGDPGWFNAVALVGTCAIDEKDDFSD